VRSPRSGGTIAALVIGGAVLAAGLVFAVMQGLTPPDDPRWRRRTVVAPPEAVVGPAKVAPGDAAVATPCPEGMVLIEGGRFFMGTDADKPVLAMARPAHKVEVARFCIDMHEVTTEDYVKCSDAGECKRAFSESFWPQGSMKRSDWEKARAAYSPLCNFGAEDRGRHPINCVMWSQADEYCRVHGQAAAGRARVRVRGARLGRPGVPVGRRPAERAAPQRLRQGVRGVAQGGRAVASVEPLYPEDDGHVGTAPVGSAPAGRTQAGLLDIVGNVFEWTADPFQARTRVEPRAAGRRRRRRSATIG
jgi:formylglycine-generating enzyme required for sulfatase activity